jgi:ElaB/YqjD/DUF883 family membrane-anchored ribosome-binding protein
MTSSQAAGAAGSAPHGSVSANLHALRGFAKELEHQIEALLSTRDDVGALAAAQIRLGNFAEADLLLARFKASIEQMRSLLEKVRDAIAFASQVSVTVANTLEGADQYHGAAVTSATVGVA